MNYIPRQIYPLIKDRLYQGKTILLYGARRVGKTRLVRQLVEEEQGQYYNAEVQQVRDQLSTTNTELLKGLVGNKKLVVFDEAQSIAGIGLILKVLHDTFPDVQFVATGSSSFELLNATAEPLTGRSRQYILYPVSFSELQHAYGFMDANANLENLLRFGSYPEVLGMTDEEKETELHHILTHYLLKDAQLFGNLKRSDLLIAILRMLAYQVGSEVSLNEIANKTGTNVHTVQRYLYLLEQSYAIIGLASFSRNLRNEIGKSRKYYFMDLGIRNALINQFNPISMRNDIGQLWENFCVIERMKRNEYSGKYVNPYFWRTYDQKEIDYLEEAGGQLSAFEFKWIESTGKAPKAFMEGYPGSEYKVVSKSNYVNFVN